MDKLTIERAGDVNWDLEADVVVIGAGGCGMAAALAAAQNNAQVLLLEKGSRVSGSTALSTSMIPAAGTRYQRMAGIADSPEIMADDILSKNAYAGDPEMTLNVCQHSAATVEWLTDYAQVKLELVTDFLYTGHSRHRMHTTKNRTGSELVEQLLAAIRGTPRIELVLNAPARTLIADKDGRVQGVLVETGGRERVRARKVILATSGFGANKDMVGKYCPEIASALYFGGEGNTGEGILWGIELGAATANMDAYQGHGSVAYPHGTLVTWVVVVQGGFIVNRLGKRFGDETEGYSPYAVKILCQPDGVAYDIYDQRIDTAVQSFADYQECLKAGAIRRGQSIEELGHLLHLPPEPLHQTLDEYNQAYLSGRDPFGRTELRPLEPPFFGVQITGALFHTQGGLKVDHYARVLRPDGSVIPNLYAGGGAAVGLSGRSSAGYLAGNGLLAALVLGKIAGGHAARDRE